MECVFQSVEIFFYFATLQPLMKWGIISSRTSLFDKEPTYGFPVYKSFSDYDIYSDKKETSDFHGTVSFDPVKMLQQK